MTTTPLIQQLESARAVIEARFLDASDLLAEAVDGIAALVASLDGVTQALNPAAMEEAAGQLRRAAAMLLALPEAQKARRAVIGQIGGEGGQLAARIDDMRRCLAYMRAFTVSIKITAGGIPEADAEFEIFAQEIGSRVLAGRGEVEALDQGLAALKAELAEAAARAEMLERGCAQMIPAVPDQLLASVAVLAAQRGRLAAAAADTGALARDVRKRVTRILSALQIGDMTRQRVEHVQAGLAMLAGVAAAPVRAAFCALLAAQLEASLADFDREVGQIASGLAGLGVDAAALLRLRELTHTEGDDAPGGFVKTLQQRIEAAMGLVSEIEQTDALAQATGAKAAQAAQLLAARLQAVQALKSDVLYMALNTTLKSARLGDAGRPLSTIATELRAQAGHLDDAASGCVAVLQTLIGRAARLGGTPPEGGDESAGAALLAAIAQLTQAGSGGGLDGAALAAQSEAVLELVRRSTERLAFQQEIGSTLAAVAQALDGQAVDAGPGDAAQGAVLADLFERLGKIYTMAQEREIQAAVAARFGLDAPAAVVVDELEDALF